MMSLRHVSDHRSELLEHQPKNDTALAQGPAQALSERLIFGMKKRLRFGCVSGFQTRLLSSYGVFGVKLSVISPIQNESLFHPNLRN
jgi:hypothetical protein